MSAHAQVQAMQEKAKQETAQLNLQVLAKAKERSGAGANTRAELMPGLTAKLQAAISALQEGLVERDTEVLTPAPGRVLVQLLRLHIFAPTFQGISVVWGWALE